MHIFQDMTLLTLLWPTLQAKDSKPVELLLRVGTK